MKLARPVNDAPAGRLFVGIVLAVALGTAAHAAAPAEGSEQWQLLHPFKAWIEDVRGPRGLCCSIADGRVVEARRVAGGRWQVLFQAEPGFPPGWQDVPDDAVVPGRNPVGLPMAWWFQGEVRCFVAGSGS